MARKSTKVTHWARPYPGDTACMYCSAQVALNFTGVYRHVYEIESLSVDSEADATAFIRSCVAHQGKAFHPDTSAEDIGYTGVTAHAYDRMMADAQSFIDVYALALEAMTQ